MKQCLIFRTHFYTLEQVRVVDELFSNLPSEIDRYIGLNIQAPGAEVVQEWKKEGYKVITFDEESLKKKYPFYEGPWFSPQNGFVEMANQLPGYDYYWFWEYDLRFNGNLVEFLSSHQGRSEDLLGTWVQPFSECTQWHWWYEEKSHWDIPLEKRWKYFAAVSRCSARLMEVLGKEIQTTYAMIEPYIPSVCVKYYGEKSIGNVEERYWTRETMVACPSHGDEALYQLRLKFMEKYQNKLIHPVK